MAVGKKLLCLSNVAWNDRWTRRQAIMAKLRDVEIIYINPPVFSLSFIKKVEDIQPTTPYPNIKVYDTFAPIAFESYLGKTSDLARKIFLTKYINDILRKEGFVAPLIWVYSPLYYDILGSISNSGIIYDCAENHITLNPGSKPSYMYLKEKLLCEKAVAVFVAYQFIYDRLAMFNKKTYLIPNGIDIKPNAPEPKDSLELSARIANLKRPIYGFSGILRRNVDYNILNRLSELEGSILCVGGVAANEGLSESVQELDAKKNVVIVKDASRITASTYMSYFDVCINPLKPGGNTIDVSAKVFLEYLATGKPIVTTRRPTVVSEYNDVVDIADNAEQFVNFAKTAVLRYGNAVRERQLAYARECTWDARISEMRRLLAREGFLVD